MVDPAEAGQRDAFNHDFAGLWQAPRLGARQVAGKGGGGGAVGQPQDADAACLYLPGDCVRRGKSQHPLGVAPQFGAVVCDEPRAESDERERQGRFSGSGRAKDQKPPITRGDGCGVKYRVGREGRRRHSGQLERRCRGSRFFELLS